MSGGTTLSGIKPPAKNPGADNPRRLAGAIPLHLIILLLACTLWWIARDMVAVNRTLRDAATVRFALDDALQDRWRIVSAVSMPISLETSGPTREINKFSSELEVNRNLFGYRFVITEADLQNLQPDARHQVSFQADMRKFERSGEGATPSELQVKPVAGDRTYLVVLEQFISRPAAVDLASGVAGRVEGYSFSQRIQPEFEIEVYGAAGVIDAMTNRAGRAVLNVAGTDINQILRNRAQVEGKSVESLLKQASLVANLQLVPVENLTIRRKGQTVAIAEVPIEFTFSELQDWAKVAGDLPVSILMPNWLAQKKSLSLNLAKTLPVELQVLSSQQENFPAAVRVVIDITQIKEAQQAIEAPPDGGPGPRRLRLSNIYYSLLVNRDRLTVKPFENPKVTTETYLPVELEISWVE